MEGNDVNYWLNRGEEFYRSDNFEEAIKCYNEVIRLDPNCPSVFYRLGNTLFKLGKTKKDDSLLEEACEKYEKASQVESNGAYIFYNWGVALYELYNNKKDVSLLEEACEKYDKASQIKSDDDGIFYNWGVTLYELYNNKKDVSLLEKACEKYDTASQIKPDNADIFYYWGIVLSQLYNITKDASLLEKACEKYDKATQLELNDENIFVNWGNTLYILGNKQLNESLLEKACEKYDKAAQLNLGYAGMFLNWANALYILDDIRQDDSLLEKACEKYDKAAQLEPARADIFIDWGIALSKLGITKKDESLFEKACEKYDKAARLEPNNANVFFSWGLTLSCFSEIKQKESVLEEVCEKFNKATQIKFAEAGVFYIWGDTLQKLAQIKQDISLFKEAFEKFDNATRLESNNIYIFTYWGITLCCLANIDQYKSLCCEEFEFFEKASKNVVDSDILLIKVALCLILNLPNKAIEYFKDSKKSILDILAFLDKENGEIVQSQTFYPLLDSDTFEGRFFQETTKNIIDKKMLDKYKKAYISSIFIINQLHVRLEKENERSVAHYRQRTISQEMLFKGSKFRLSAINYSNDPTEGGILFDYLFGKGSCSKKETLITGYGAFAGCFTFSYDSLNQFRLYGKENDNEGVGLSLVFQNSFFSGKAKLAMSPNDDVLTKEQILSRSISEEKEVGILRKNRNIEERLESINHSNKEVRLMKEQVNTKPKDDFEKLALFRCIYIDPDERRVVTVGQKEEYLFYREKNEGAVTDYSKYVSDLTKSLRTAMEELKALVNDLERTTVGQLLINLRYLIKHVAFKEEQECRIIKICSLKDKGIEVEDCKRMYVKYEPNVSDHVKEIYFGPKAAGMELFQDILTNKGLNISCERSRNPLA